MRFKTVIKLVSEASNKNEALEVVEEYLAGNIVSGVDMKCVTRPLHNKTKIAAVAALLFMAAVGIYMLSTLRQIPCSLPVVSGVSAVQPPLNTSGIAQDEVHFKRDWQDRHIKEALDYISK